MSGIFTYVTVFFTNEKDLPSVTLLPLLPGHVPSWRPLVSWEFTFNNRLRENCV